MAPMRKTKLAYEIVAQPVELKRNGLCDADIIATIDVHPTSSLEPPRANVTAGQLAQMKR